MTGKTIYSDDYIRFRASKELKERVKKAANELGVGMSEYVRSILSRQANKDLQLIEDKSNG